MKNFLYLCLFFFLCYNIVEAQTNVNIPGPENVLVVYNENSDTSIMVKNYYVTARDIPESNIVKLPLPRKAISVGDWSDPHVVKLGFDNQNIVDSTWARWDSTHCVDTAKFHAYQYFIEEIANPIRQHITNNNLTEKIRYIVMCQGIPYKIQAVGDWSSPGNIGVDGLLCMLNTADYDDFVKEIFNNLVDDCYPGCYPPPYNCYSSPIIYNPYFDEDSNFDFDSRFKSDHYTGTWGAYTYKLSYLVSRLDGLSFEVIKDMIDRSVEEDKSGEAAWILDNDPASNGIGVNSHFTYAKSRLENYGFNVVYNNTDTWITHNTYIGGPVMGYTSLGVHAEGSNPAYQTYVIDSLLFDYANGSVFNTFESFNAYSISTLRRPGQGLMTEFTLVGGTSGAGHIWEPYASAVSKPYVYFPYYAMGYTQIDAAWQGLAYLAWRNVVVGDPLTAIAWGKQSLITDLSWEGTNLVTGEIDIPELKTLTIANNSVINLRHQGFITGEGKLIIGQNVTFNIYSWEKGLFLSYDSDHPRLVWGAHPTLGSSANYKVYRRFSTDNPWELLTTTTALEYTDLQMQFNLVGDAIDNLFYKVIASSELPGTYESNIVSCAGGKSRKKGIADQPNTSPFVYSLEQNYPNPFNPTTQIKYSIKESGLVQLKIYDVLGNEIATLVNENKEAGIYSVNFDASKLTSGVYIYQLTAPGFTQARKMILAK